MSADEVKSQGVEPKNQYLKLVKWQKKKIWWNNKIIIIK